MVLFLRVYLSLHLFTVWCFSFLGAPKKIDESGAEVLLTGTFYSDNWIMAHVRPLAMAERCRRIRLVSTHPFKSFENVEVVIPSKWMVSVFGDVGARLLVFLWIAVTSRPHIIGGFHLLFNGLVASFIASIVRVRSIYFCVGGPAEMLEGGFQSENRLFDKIEQPDERLESDLLRAVSHCDLVITMGSGAKEFFEERGVQSEIHVVSGGIEIPDKHTLDRAERQYSLLFVGRLVPIKRVDIFIDMVAAMRRHDESVRAAIVGDGPLSGELQARAKDAGVLECIEFAGYQDNVKAWLLKSKLFVLTSESEGLSLALMEAMSYGLPAIVSDVGDLSDMIDNGVNGFLVGDHSAEEFAKSASTLLSNDSVYERASLAAYNKGAQYSTACCTNRWDEILGNSSTEVQKQNAQSHP